MGRSHVPESRRLSSSQGFIPACRTNGDRFTAEELGKITRKKRCEVAKVRWQGLKKPRRTISLGRCRHLGFIARKIIKEAQKKDRTVRNLPFLLNQAIASKTFSPSSFLYRYLGNVFKNVLLFRHPTSFRWDRIVKDFFQSARFIAGNRLIRFFNAPNFKEANLLCPVDRTLRRHLSLDKGLRRPGFFDLRAVEMVLETCTSFYNVGKKPILILEVDASDVKHPRVNLLENEDKISKRICFNQEAPLVETLGESGAIDYGEAAPPNSAKYSSFLRLKNLWVRRQLILQLRSELWEYARDELLSHIGAVQSDLESLQKKSEEAIESEQQVQLREKKGKRLPFSTRDFINNKILRLGDLQKQGQCLLSVLAGLSQKLLPHDTSSFNMDLFLTDTFPFIIPPATDVSIALLGCSVRKPPYAIPLSFFLTTNHVPHACLRSIQKETQNAVKKFTENSPKLHPKIKVDGIPVLCVTDGDHASISLRGEGKNILGLIEVRGLQRTELHRDIQNFVKGIEAKTSGMAYKCMTLGFPKKLALSEEVFSVVNILKHCPKAIEFRNEEGLASRQGTAEKERAWLKRCFLTVVVEVLAKEYEMDFVNNWWCPDDPQNLSTEDNIHIFKRLFTNILTNGTHSGLPILAFFKLIPWKTNPLSSAILEISNEVKQSDKSPRALFHEDTGIDLNLLPPEDGMRQLISQVGIIRRYIEAEDAVGIPREKRIGRRADMEDLIYSMAPDFWKKDWMRAEMVSHWGWMPIQLVEAILQRNSVITYLEKNNYLFEERAITSNDAECYFSVATSKGALQSFREFSKCCIAISIEQRKKVINRKELGYCLHTTTESYSERMEKSRDFAKASSRMSRTKTRTRFVMKEQRQRDIIKK